MVRRRGIYEIKIRGQQLTCSFCKKNRFTHREVYMDLLALGKKAEEKLTLQSFSCIKCGDIRFFEEKNRFDHDLKKHVSIIEYMEVNNE